MLLYSIIFEGKCQVAGECEFAMAKLWVIQRL